MRGFSYINEEKLRTFIQENLALYHLKIALFLYIGYNHK